MSTIIAKLIRQLLIVAVLAVASTAFTARAADLKKVYFKDGNAVECDRVWKGPGGDSVWYKKSHGVIGCLAEAVDMEKTFEIPLKVKHLVDESYRDFQKEDWDGVITSTSRALELDGTNPIAYTNRAGAYNYVGLAYKAIDDCDRAIAVDPQFGLAYNNRGHALELLGKTEDAALDYQKGCNLGSDLACRNCEDLEVAGK